MSIITISREFGSGGRELGKRLAESLGFPCYDHEIIEMVAQKQGVDKDYIAHVSEKDIRVFYTSTIARRFIAPHPMTKQAIDVYVAQQEILKELASRTQSDVWDFQRPSKSDLYPTMKPVELMQKMITNSSYWGENVLDLFGGSGTTLIACENTNRKANLMELDPKYVDVIVNRYKDKIGTSGEVYLLRDGEKIPYAELS